LERFWNNRYVQICDKVYGSRAVNARAEPSASARIAANMKRGVVVMILEKRGS
jgi:hypothetical protein